MKINLFKSFLLVLLATLVPQLADAYDFKVNGLCYNKNSDGTSVTVTFQDQTYDNTSWPSYPSLSGTVTIPANVTYGGKTYLVTAIGLRTFHNCTNVTSVSVPNSVTSIGYRAFKGCTKLNSVNIPNAVTIIDFEAFADCSNLTSLVIPNSVTTIGYSAFQGCTKITSVDIPNSVTSIGSRAFMNCTKLSSVTIPSSVINIEYGTFANCFSLTTVQIPNTVTKIGSSAFEGCTRLTSVSIPNSVTIIESNTFSGCRGLTSVTIPGSITKIGQRAFKDCIGLSSLSIPSSVTTIDIWAFEGCTGLTTVTIPNTVTSIGFNPFIKCNNITSIVVSSGNPKYDSRNNCNAIIETASNTLVGGCINTSIPLSVTALGNWSLAYIGMTSIVLHNTIKSIGDYVFNGCTNLTSVSIPNTVKSIGIRTFANCRNLTYITIPNSVTTIDEEAFLECNSLESIAIPNSVTKIGNYAFKNCTGLTSVTIPNSVTSVGSTAFYNCSNLTSLTLTGKGAWNAISNMPTISQLKTVNIGSEITSLGSFGFNPEVVNCYAVEPPTCQSTTFSSYDGALHVPSESLASYFTTNYWQMFNNINNSLTEKVIISQTQASVPQNGLTLSATTIPAGANVVWTSSKPSVATVNTEGVVTPNSQGQCDIFASLASNPAIYASCHVSSTNPEIQLSLNHSELEMKYGEEAVLVATFTPDLATLTPYWYSSNTNVATVRDGVVTAVGEGECTITVRVLNTSATCHVIVDPVTVSLNYSEIEMQFGESATLLATIDPDNAGLNPIWTSSDESVATVENGVVTAVGDGECDITARVLTKTATCHVIVNSNVTISLNVKRALLGANQLMTVYPSCTPDVPVDLVVTSSDPSVAVVRLIDTANAPTEGLLSFTEKGMALAHTEKLPVLYDSKAPAMADTKAIMIVGVKNGTATVTVATTDGMATPAILELRVVDVNGDHVVTAADVTALYDNLLNNDMTYYDTSDINGDGNITAADITAIYDLLLGSTPTPSEPTSDVMTYTVGGVSFKMVRVEGGMFTMGATAEQGSDAGYNENPAHQVTLSSFSIGQTEVTQDLWQAVMGNNPSNCNGDDYGINLQRPVELVSWDDCQEFIAKLNQMTGENFRMPTEAEWEYAARGGNKSLHYKYCGSNNVGDVAWYRDNALIVDNANRGTHAVATKQPNELGLYDMSGNVWEWCLDWYDNYSTQAQVNPTGPASGTGHVNRGGGWNAGEGYCRVSWRGGSSHDHRGLNLGLRLAK